MRRKKKTSKFIDEAILVKATVTEIIEKNKEYSHRIKNVFKCASQTGIDKMCILWGRSNIDVGDEVQMQGRFKDDVFLAWSIQILKKEQKNEYKRWKNAHNRPRTYERW